MTEDEAYALRARGRNIERRVKNGNDTWRPLPDVPEWEYRERRGALFEGWVNVYPNMDPRLYLSKTNAELRRRSGSRTIKVREVEGAES